jgi:hypothetical protein
MPIHSGLACMCLQNQFHSIATGLRKVMKLIFTDTNIGD